MWRVRKTLAERDKGKKKRDEEIEEEKKEGQ